MIQNAARQPQIAVMDVMVIDSGGWLYKLYKAMNLNSNIPQALNHLFLKEIVSYFHIWIFWVPGVCSRGLLDCFF